MRARLLFLAFLFVISNKSFAQLIGTNAFLQGQFLEIGVQGNGSFGAFPSPPGYHNNCACAPVSTLLDEVYDWGHDGWTTGTPAYMGGYTSPGAPVEGWSLSVNGVQSQADVWGSTTYGGPAGALTGSLVSYSNSGGRVIANWSGAAGVAGALTMRQETRVDTFASWVVVTTYFRNTSGAAIPNVYYNRYCDPDNATQWGGSFATNNTIVYQNDWNHRVMVSTSDPTMGPASTYLAYGTKDCRAKAYIVHGSLSATTQLADIYNQTGAAATYTYLGTYSPNDVGIGLVYNIGTIAANDSAIISYAYIFNGDNGIDSAFPDPVLVMNHTTTVYDMMVRTHLDTFDACTLPPNVDTLPVDILHAIDKCWSWSSWTWSPSTALSATTGTSVVIDMSAIPTYLTYTVTGTDSSVHMLSCNKKTFTFTVHSCHKAFSNNPCLGDTLNLWMVGDSVGASYFWYRNPAGFTAATQRTYKYPATYADSGMYYVIKTTGAVHDTDSVRVIVYDWPTLNLTTNIPLCGSPLLTTLNLGVSPGTPGEIFSWTGPNGFTGSGAAPSNPAFTYADTGYYVVRAIDAHGCRNSDSIFVYPGIFPSFRFDKYPGCLSDSVVFTDSSVNASRYEWRFGDGSAYESTFHATHVYAPPHSVWTVTLALHNTRCDTTITYDVDLRHFITANFDISPDTICYGTPTTFTDASIAKKYDQPTTIAAYSWNFRDGTANDNTAGPITHTFIEPGEYPVTLKVTDDISCQDSITKSVFVLKLSVRTIHDTTLCVSQPLALVNDVSIDPNIKVPYLYEWSPGDKLDSTNVKTPYFFGLGLTTYTFTVMVDPSIVAGGCPASDTMRIHSVLGVPIFNVTPNSSIPYGGSIHLNADSQVYYTWKPTDGSLDNPNINSPTASPTKTTIYTVYGLDVNGCLDSAFVTIFVDSSMDESIPSAFTPNGDGLNDIFRPVGIKYQRLVDFRVFNKWGQEVFYSNSYKNGWDGKFKGEPQDLGVYFYTITVARPGGEGDNVMYRGDVTLIR